MALMASINSCEDSGICSHDSTGKFKVSDAEPTREELKVLHKTLKKSREGY
jgi:hypothetical protein